MMDLLRARSGYLGLSCAAWLAIPVAPAWAGGGLVTGDVHTARFAVETNFNGGLVLDQGHIDLVVYYCGGVGSLTWGIREPPVATNYFMDEAYAFASVDSRETMTAALTNDFGFIGAGVGETFWNLNQNFVTDQLFLGVNAIGDVGRLATWNPMDPDRFAYFEGRHVRVDLLAVRGPPGGHFSLFQFGATPTVYLSTFLGGVTAEDRFYIQANAHDHFNWSFSRPGLYEIDFRLSTQVQWDDSITVTIDSLEAADGPGDIVRWPTDPCTRYTLEATADVSDLLQWQPVPGAVGISSTGPEVVVTNFPPTNSAWFYRVLAGP